MESPFRGKPDTSGVKLIETMLWDGHRVPRLALHMARLAAGAAALGWGLPDVAAHLAGLRPDAPARLRLTLDGQGVVAVETGPVPPRVALWRVGVAGPRLVSTDPWLAVKSTRRAAYDQARASLAPGLDEVVFLNEHGQVCDGSITTLFFDAGAGMRTPPLSCGLLPGVLRAELACPEQVLMAADLPHVRLWLGNSLRGLCPARFVAGV